MKRQTTPEATPILPVAIDTATLELLARWRAEDATDDPEELRLAEQELAAFKKAMNENRRQSGEPIVYP